MFLEESLWIKGQIHAIRIKTGAKVLDVGSASLEYRTKMQPYIEQNIFKLLQKLQCKIFHLDCKKQEGVDIECDINNLDKLSEQYDLIICANLLEHIKNRDRFAKDIVALMNNEGHLIVTVPYNLDYHPDPIDTLYRPSPKELEELFDSLVVIDSELVDTPSALHHYNRIKAIVDLLLMKRYKVSCGIFKKVL
ncbi:methyltransferase domain-containing protein [Candidatus Omnitrophota bacterium]